MPNYFITGRPGVGKTTVINELQARGFAAYSTDEVAGVTELEDINTGVAVPFPERPIDWTRYSWNWQAEPLQKLLESDETVFVGAVTGNQSEFYPLFDAIFALTIDAETLRTRLSNHEYPRTEAEIDSAVTHFEQKQARFLNDQFICIDAVREPSEIVDSILTHLQLD